MRLSTFTAYAAILFAAGTSLHAGSITFGLLNDPGQNYTFQTSSGQNVTDPVGPYPGFLGANVAGDLYGFFCIDYVKTANWGGTYSGTVYHIGDAIPGKTLQQQLEAGYLSDALYQLGGSSASTNLYQGPISFAIWQIMDTTPGDVPVDPAAQPWILQAQNMYNSGALHSANFSQTLIFVPDNPAVQDFMTLSPDPLPPASAPEPVSLALAASGALLIGLSQLRRRKA